MLRKSWFQTNFSVQLKQWGRSMRCSTIRRHRWEDNIKMDLRGVGWGRGGIDWIDVSHDRDSWWAFVYAEINLWLHKMRGIS